MPDNPLGLFGYLAGQLHTNPQGGILGQAIPQGAARPFARGEYMDNPNGSWSSEMTYTLQDPTLNAGRPTLVPGLWLKDGKPYHATEDEAAQMAIQSLLRWPSYSSLPQAEEVSSAREAGWQTTPRQQAGRAAPLFLPPLPRTR